MNNGEGAEANHDTAQIAKKQEQENDKLAHDAKYLQDVVTSDKKLPLGGDTYAMAFKAFNWQVMRELDLDMNEVHNAYHAAMFVFGFQLLMVLFIGSIIFGSSFQILLPKDITVLGARFVCTILMHLQVEGDMRQGLRMMKYVTNQPFDFSNPSAAFFVALMQTLGGLAAEVACIMYLSNINTAIDVIIKFVALASIAKVDDFYASALPADGNKIKKGTKPLVIRIHKRDWETYGQNPEAKNYAQMQEVGFSRYFGRFIFKTFRIVYASYIFYFLPYTSLWLPYVAAL